MANQSERGGSGNFANDPQKASEAGQKGGQHSSGGRSGGQQEQADRSTGQQGGSGSSGQQQGGSGSFKDDPEKAGEAGRKGGQHTHGGK